MTLPVVWAIGGIDPSGGAGIYQDLKVMSWSGVHPMGIPVALTSQNIDHVREVLSVDPDFILRMAGALLERHPPRGVKVGLLPEHALSAVIGILNDLDDDVFVAVDPIFRFGSGDPFLDEASFREMATCIFPLADMVLPNIPEAEVLLGSPLLPGASGLMDGALKIRDLYGPVSVYLKGGHREGRVRTDVFVDQTGCFVLDRNEVNIPSLHGGGCTLASLLVSEIVRSPDSPIRDLLDSPRNIFQRALEWESSRPGNERRTFERFFSTPYGD
ncbi:hydroxymethylpyrimidine/phosphomethylpyrimidine kinase [Leptospirillum ferrooxidans]|uniref:hydroxymethylpyrimidine kinase n=2 Tax=root TaxID=1 RepID=I0IKN9_LEPFC|nr:hydroxymethylpyrimidine/phosphomethylpyrimidine kinase [Leptospirillum ferrooxidans]BAM05838.1 putative phosphomethylpyrimidine kinase [Leptospirillum ferrooxidans C2-3]